MARHNAQGSAAEDLAMEHLLKQGLRLIERNFRTRAGEIDLIMQQGNTLVFVEVRFRQSCHYGSPAETVTAHKQQRLIHTAAHYLQRHRLDLPCRFDIVAISGSRQERIEWVQDAFQLS
jgi:putative endonuclease